MTLVVGGGLGGLLVEDWLGGLLLCSFQNDFSQQHEAGMSIACDVWSFGKRRDGGLIRGVVLSGCVFEFDTRLRNVRQIGKVHTKL